MPSMKKKVKEISSQPTGLRGWCSATTTPTPAKTANPAPVVTLPADT